MRWLQIVLWISRSVRQLALQLWLSWFHLKACFVRHLSLHFVGGLSRTNTTAGPERTPPRGNYRVRSHGEVAQNFGWKWLASRDATKWINQSTLVSYPFILSTYLHVSCIVYMSVSSCQNNWAPIISLAAEMANWSTVFMSSSKNRSR